MNKDYNNKLSMSLLLLSVILFIITTFITVIFLIPKSKEDVEISNNETTEISIETTYRQQITSVIEEEILFWISKTGKRYHSKPDCSNMKNPLQVTINEAEIRDYTPCMRCNWINLLDI